jgi:VWFA-related protein
MPTSICRQFLSLCLLSVLSFALLRPTTAQEQDAVRIKTDLVVLDAQVTDKNTRAVIGGLTLQDFELFEDDVKQQIEYFSQDKLPLSVVLLLDISPSVSPVLEQIGKGALQALQHLKPEDEIALMTFAGVTETIQNFTKDRQLILDKINFALTKEGHGTRIHEAIGHAARKFRDAAVPSSRRAIVVVTDNQGSMNRTDDPVSEAQIRDAVVESGATVCGVIVKSFLNVLDGIMFQHPMMQEHFKRTTVNPYAEMTGGEMTAASKETVNTRLGEMFDRLRSRYSLGYNPANQDFNGKFRRIRLSLTAAARTRLSGEPVITAKQGYFATDKEIENLIAEEEQRANAEARKNASRTDPQSASTDNSKPATDTKAARPDAGSAGADGNTSIPSDPGRATPAQPEPIDSLEQLARDEAVRPYAHLVMLDVLAMNKKTGVMVSSLNKNDFEIDDNGVKQPIVHFSRGESPISLVLLVDVTANIGYAMSSLRRSVRLWTSKLNADDQIALMAFAGRAIVMQDFTTDRRAIAGKLRNFVEDASRQDLGAGRNRLGALFEAAEQLDQRANPLARRVIVVITDDTSVRGFEGGGKPEIIAERVLGARCSVYALVSGGYRPSQKGKVTRAVVESAIYSFGNPLSFLIGLGTRIASEAAIDAITKDRSFGRLVVRSGGSAARADGDQTSDELSSLLDNVRNRYVIGFAPQAYKSGERYRKLKLDVTSEAKKRAGEVSVVSAEGYFARKSYPGAAANASDSTKK